MGIEEIIKNIREEKLDCNSQELFFSKLIMGLLNNLDNSITIRKQSVPHFIISTGDDIMYLGVKGQNQAIEPFEISNEDYVYNQIPRCIINTSNIDLLTDQLTSPSIRGSFEYITNDGVFSLSAEFRRTPLKLNCELKYYVDPYTDMLELIQQIITKLSFIRTYYITYMGQQILCSYKIPDSFQDEHTMEISGNMTDSRYKSLTLSLEVETNIPVFYNRTVVDNSKIITKTKNTVITK